MLVRVRRVVVVLLFGAMPVLAAVPVGAQVQGACTASFNGIGVDRIDTLDSPLELDTTDTLVFAGTSDAGVLHVDVKLMIGPVTIESGSTTYATPAAEFEASISLDDVSPYGVGLFRVIGEADGCLGEAWVRVSGRFPLATLTGLTALGLALGGITGQLGAIVSRNRWSRSAAALGGIATGSGVAVIAQQFGRLQLSYPSLAAVSAVAASAGSLAAWFLNPTLREARAAQRASSASPRRTSTTPQAEHRSTRMPTDERRRAHDSDTPVPNAGSDTDPAPSGTPAPTAPPEAGPAPDSGPYWCYVMAPTDVFDLTDHTRTVATIVPGTWYLAKRSVGGWVHVVASDGEEGWVAVSAIHRHG